MAEQPVYTSRSSLKSLGQEYRIYEDHLELGWVFGTISIPFEDISHVEVVPPTASREGMYLHFHPFKLHVAKLDFSDIERHVMLDKATGFWQRFDFTPENPDEFKAALDRAMAQHRGQCGGSDG